MRLIVPLAVAAALSACAITDQAPDASTGIAASSEQFEAAFNDGNAAGVAAQYTDDAVVQPPGAARVDGREAIQELWQSYVDADVGDIDLITVALADHGDSATEFGRFSVTAPDGSGGRVTVTGSYIVLWKRGEDGVWRLHWDLWNDDSG